MDNRVIELRVKLPLGQGLLVQAADESDEAFFERAYQAIAFRDMTQGELGRFKASVSVYDGDGKTLWMCGVKSKGEK